MQVIKISDVPTISCTILEESDGGILYRVLGDVNGVHFDQDFFVTNGYAACYDWDTQQLYTTKIELNGPNDVILAL